MSKFYLRFVCIGIVLCTQFTFAQQTSVNVWRSQMQTCGLNLQKLYNTCAHFPKLETFTNDALFETAVKQWQQQFPNEEKAFWNLEEVKKANPSAYYLGLGNGVEKKQFANSIWEWVQASKITNQRLTQIAPHFPKPKLTDNPEADEKLYNDELKYWSSLYPIEYEHLFNAAELAALNPYYTGYYKPVLSPAFLSAPLRETKPVREKYPRTVKGEMNYQLALRAWMFVYDAPNFEKQFGKDYEFPSSFNGERYRAMVKKKFADSKHPCEEQLKSHTGK